LLRVLAPVRVIAADVDPAKLDQAKALGADDVVRTKNVDEALRTGSAVDLPPQT
jgi:hypothetical protein